MIDAHSHLHDTAFDADRDFVVRRAFERGIRAIITIGTDIEESEKAIACATKYENVYAAVGMHPHEFGGMVHEKKEAAHWIETLESLAKNPKVVAIGECGLDYFSRDPSMAISDAEKNQQKEIFQKQIELAKKLDLPVVVHCRSAYTDVATMLRETTDRPDVVVHCHEGNITETQALLELGCVFSFAGNVTYKERAGSERNEMIRMMPIDRILAETDCPYLSPVPHRGERNEPSYVLLTAEKIAEIKGISKEAVMNAVEENAKRIFGV